MTTGSRSHRLRAAKSAFWGVAALALLLAAVARAAEPLWIEGVVRGNPTLIFTDGEAVALQVDLFNPVEEEQAVEGAFYLADYYGEERVLQEFARDFEEYGFLRVDLPVVPERRGIFRVVARYVVDGVLHVEEDVAAFAVVPPLDSATVPETSPFGLITRLSHTDVLRAKKLGVKWVRLHDFSTDTWWHNVQPRPDQWIVNEGAIRQALEAGIEILGTLGAAPPWAYGPVEGTPPFYGPYPPNDWQDYVSYAERIMAHFKGRIKVWQVWNEPNHEGYWLGSPEEYAHMVRLTAEAARRVDPEIRILAGGSIPATVRHLNWLERTFRAGMLEYADIIGIHGGSWEPLAGDAYRPGRAEVSDLAETLRAMMRRWGEEKPIWNDEATMWARTIIGSLDYGNDRYTPQDGAIELVRMYLDAIEAGVEKIFYYFAGSFPKDLPTGRFHPGPDFHQSLLEYNGWPSVKVPAYAGMTWFLSDAAFVERVYTNGGAVEMNLFQSRADETRLVAVVWTAYGPHYDGEFRVSLAGAPAVSLKAFDIMSNPVSLENGTLVVTASPVYLEISGVSAEAWIDWWARITPR